MRSLSLSFSGRTLCVLLAAGLGGCASQEAPPPATEAGAGGSPSYGGAGGAPAQTGGSSSGSPNATPDAGQAGSADDASYDASALSIERQAGTSFCRLSTDHRHLIVRLRNDAAEPSPETSVEVRTTGSDYRQRLDAPVLGTAQGVDLFFDRGALTGFSEVWDFEIRIDPDDELGIDHAPESGQCRDLRSRASAGMAQLAAWYDEGSGLWNGNAWWTGANMLEVTIDYSRETGDPTYTPLLEKSFAQETHAGFINEFYDDEGWWALTWIKAYDLTRDQKYLDMAKSLFEDMKGGWNDVCGGGIYWKKGAAYRAAIANELFLTIAARLHLRTPGDTGPGSYLDWAKRQWAWFEQTGLIKDNHRVVDGLNEACEPVGPAYTYNQGVILGGLTDLWRATGDEALLDTADDIAHAALDYMTDADGVFIEAICDPNCGEGDGLQFKGVFARNLAYLHEARPLAAYQEFLIRQSDSIWTTSRNADDQFGKRWQGPFDQADSSRQSSALDAIVGAVRAANVNLALRGTASGSAPCAAQEDADRAIDGSSRWGSKWCSGGASGQKLTIDLGKSRYVVGFRVRHAGAGGEDPLWNTADFAIETSEEGQTWTTLVSVSGNSDDVTTHWVPAVDARYARLKIDKAQNAGNTPAARIYEFEVFGLGLE